MAREDHSDVMKEVMRTRFEREVDPEGKLSPDDRAKLARAAARRKAAELNAAKARKRAVQRRAASLPAAVQAGRLAAARSRPGPLSPGEPG